MTRRPRRICEPFNGDLDDDRPFLPRTRAGWTRHAVGQVLLWVGLPLGWALLVYLVLNEIAR